MFTHMHSTQKENWWPKGVAIATHTNFFPSQQEHNNIILPNKRIIVTTLPQHTVNNNKNLIGSIKEEGHPIKLKSSTLLVADLEMQNIFKDKNKEEGNIVMDKLIMKVL